MLFLPSLAIRYVSGFFTLQERTVGSCCSAASWERDALRRPTDRPGNVPNGNVGSGGHRREKVAPGWGWGPWEEQELACGAEEEPPFPPAPHCRCKGEGSRACPFSWSLRREAAGGGPTGAALPGIGVCSGPIRTGWGTAVYLAGCGSVYGSPCHPGLPGHSVTREGQREGFRQPAWSQKAHSLEMSLSLSGALHTGDPRGDGRQRMR